jgi:hypothetical protein
VNDLKRCPLCLREIPRALESRHHLTPRLKGGKKGPVVILHTICHGKIHSLLSETELARDYSTVEALRGHEEIGTFLRWVRKRPIDYRSGNRINRDHSKKRRKT